MKQKEGTCVLKMRYCGLLRPKLIFTFKFYIHFQCLEERMFFCILTNDKYK